MLPIILASLEKIREENNFSSSAVTTLGETTTNQLGSSLKVEIKEGSRDLRLFIKFLDPSQQDGDFYEESLIYFRNEIVFYKEIAGHFRSDAEEDGTPTLTCLAKCYGTSSDQGEEQEVPFIVLEDLTAKGYTTLDTKHPLTSASARTVVRQLGQLHAHSMALSHRQPDRLARATCRLRETVFRPNNRRLFTGAIHDAYRLATKAFPAESAYVDALGGFVLGVFDNLHELVKGEDEEDEECKVVTHGDLWLNNVLCKRDPSSGEICDAVFVDFQGCRYSSPVHDLMLLLLTGLEVNKLEQHGDRLVEAYRESLGDTLACLGVPHLGPPASDVWGRQLTRHAPVALGLALAGLPVFLRDEGRHSGEVRSDPVRNPSLQAFLHRLAQDKTLRCKNRMLELVVYAVNHGYV